MLENVLCGMGSDVVRKPAAEWLDGLYARAPVMREKLRLGRDARKVREFAVTQLARNSGMPLEPEAIAESLAFPLAQVRDILADLEKRLFFLVLDGAGCVSWAFPVTSARTPHRLQLSTGEVTWGA